MSTFGERLKYLRSKKELTQSELSNFLVIKDRSTLAGWESNRVTPDFEMVKKIATFFNVTADFLLGLVDTEEQSVEMQTKTIDGRILEGLSIMEELSDEDYQRVLTMLQGLRAEMELKKKLEGQQ